MWFSLGTVGIAVFRPSVPPFLSISNIVAILYGHTWHLSFFPRPFPITHAVNVDICPCGSTWRFLVCRRASMWAVFVCPRGGCWTHQTLSKDKHASPPPRKTRGEVTLRPFGEGNSILAIFFLAKASGSGLGAWGEVEVEPA